MFKDLDMIMTNLFITSYVFICSVWNSVKTFFSTIEKIDHLSLTPSQNYRIIQEWIN